MSDEDKYKPKQNHVPSDVVVEDSEEIKLLKEILSKVNELLTKVK